MSSIASISYLPRALMYCAENLLSGVLGGATEHGSVMPFLS
jgi:hypothetical protein